MITNILLGLILGIVITSFIILNNKIINLYKLLSKLTDIELTTNNNITEILKLFSNLVDRFNKRILVDNEHFEIIKDLIEKNKVEIYNNQQLLYNIPVKLETFIIEENNTIRNEIKKLAKISSKIKSQSKTKKSISNKTNEDK